MTNPSKLRLTPQEVLDYQREGYLIIREPVYRLKSFLD
jgi:hypothetical protein